MPSGSARSQKPRGATGQRVVERHSRTWMRRGCASTNRAPPRRDGGSGAANARRLPVRCCLCETRAFPQPGWPSVVPLCRQCRVDLEARAQEPRPEEPKRLSLTPSYIERCQHLALAGANVALRPTVVIDLAAVRASRLAGAAAVLIALFAVFYCAPAAA